MTHQTTDLTRLLRRARRWVADDPCPPDRHELEALLERAAGGDEPAGIDLATRFTGPLTFGTAGLRGAVGAGETRMNRAVVARATAGLVRYLLDVVAEDPRVVLGCDARHGSADFARTAALVVAAAGGRALVLPPQLPTPVLAFAVRHLDADAGVMITASHNPPADNGYKVYLGGRASEDAGRGVQIVPPADGLIAQRLAAAPPAREIPGVPTDAPTHAGEPWSPDVPGVERLGDEIEQAYLARAASLAGADTQVRIVLTPLHGVGGRIATRVLADAGFTDVHLVSEQAEPDPDFPTVSFPNPEEPGALDLALALAAQVDADVVIALDPDADRCSVATPDPAVAGGWRALTGDEIGALLGEQAARRVAGDPEASLACSVVSSRQLARIAAAHGLRHTTTLTGFKWIARAPGIVFGYEEAIGYCIDPQFVRDKDGIGTAVRVASLVAGLRRDGRTLIDALDDLAREHGLHATGQVSFRVDDLRLITDAMARVRARPPRVLAAAAVTQVVDLAGGVDDLPPTDAVMLITDHDDRVVVRPSGTEPKLKCYLEVVLPCVDGRVPREQAAARVSALGADITTALRLG